jgi:hypothetical protein
MSNNATGTAIANEPWQLEDSQIDRHTLHNNSVGSCTFASICFVTSAMTPCTSLLRTLKPMVIRRLVSSRDTVQDRI